MQRKFYAFHELCIVSRWWWWWHDNTKYIVCHKLIGSICFVSMFCFKLHNIHFIYVSNFQIELSICAHLSYNISVHKNSLLLRLLCVLRTNTACNYTWLNYIFVPGFRHRMHFLSHYCSILFSFHFTDEDRRSLQSFCSSLILTKLCELSPNSIQNYFLFRLLMASLFYLLERVLTYLLHSKWERKMFITKFPCFSINTKILCGKDHVYKHKKTNRNTFDMIRLIESSFEFCFFLSRCL